MRHLKVDWWRGEEEEEGVVRSGYARDNILCEYIFGRTDTFNEQFDRTEPNHIKTKAAADLRPESKELKPHFGKKI